MPATNKTTVSLLLCLSLSLLQACSSESGNHTSTTPVSIHAINSEGQDASYPDLTTAVASASSGTTIAIPAGIHYVNNPVILNTPHLTLAGSGATKTDIRAKNPDQPVFVFASNKITLKDMMIDALVEGGPGKASIAIHMQEGIEDCRIQGTTILNTAATAILGSAVSGCILDSNIILNSGDDAVRLRGGNLTVTDNVIVRYFDEALDLAAGPDIVVAKNYVSDGRIGIVVDDTSNMVVINNIVENQITEGLVAGIDPRAVVAGNVTRDTGGIGYNLYSPQAVIANTAQGSYTGFRITDMTRGVVSGNTTRGSTHMFKFINADPDDEAATIKSDRPGHDVIFHSNCERSSWDVFNITCPEQGNNLPISVDTSRNSGAIDTSRLYNFSTDVTTQGTTEGSAKKARHVAALLRYYNPGFINFSVDEKTMTSAITADLYNTLATVGPDAIGLVRASFLRFSKGQPDYSWYLIHEGKKVIHVAPMQGGPRVKFSQILPL